MSMGITQHAPANQKGLPGRLGALPLPFEPRERPFVSVPNPEIQSVEETKRRKERIPVHERAPGLDARIFRPDLPFEVRSASQPTLEGEQQKQKCNLKSHQDADAVQHCENNRWIVVQGTEHPLDENHQQSGEQERSAQDRWNNRCNSNSVKPAVATRPIGLEPSLPRARFKRFAFAHTSLLVLHPGAHTSFCTVPHFLCTIKCSCPYLNNVLSATLYI